MTPLVQVLTVAAPVVLGLLHARSERAVRQALAACPPTPPLLEGPPRAGTFRLRVHAERAQNLGSSVEKRA